MAFYSMLAIFSKDKDFNDVINIIKSNVPCKNIRIGGIFNKSLNDINGNNVNFSIRKDLNLDCPVISERKKILERHFLAEKGLNSGRYYMLLNEYIHINLYIAMASTLHFDSIYNLSENNKLNKGYMDKRSINLTIKEWQQHFKENIYENLNSDDCLMVLEISESDTESSQTSLSDKNYIKSQMGLKKMLDSSEDFFRDVISERDERSRLNKEKLKN